VLQSNLRSNPTIDGIIAGILISKDYSKTLTVLKKITYCRKLIDDLRLKKEGALMMYKTQLEKYIDEADISKILPCLQENNGNGLMSFVQNNSEAVHQYKRTKLSMLISSDQ